MFFVVGFFGCCFFFGGGGCFLLIISSARTSALWPFWEVNLREICTFENTPEKANIHNTSEECIRILSRLSLEKKQENIRNVEANLFQSIKLRWEVDVLKAV